MKNTFCFIVNALFILKIFIFLFFVLIYDITTWLTNMVNNTHVAHISRSKSDGIMKFGQVIEYNNIFFKNHTENEAGRLVLDLFMFFKWFHMR